MKKITRVMAGIMAGAVIPLTLAGCGATNSATTTTEATTEATTAATTEAATTAATTDAITTEVAAVEKQVAEMKAKLQAFDEAHPEYEIAWNEIMKDYDDVYNKEFNTAFENIQEKIKQKSEAKSSEIDSKVIEEYGQLNQEVAEMLDKLLKAQSAESFEVFNALSKDGEAEVTVSTEVTASPVSEEEVTALVEKYEKFSEEHPEVEEKTAEYFEDVCKIVNDELTAASSNATQQIEKDVKDILANHNIDEKDEEEVNKLLNDMAKQIEESFAGSANSKAASDNINIKF